MLKSKLFFGLATSMAGLVAISNFLVQFPVSYFGMENVLTYAAFTYPITFLITDLANRKYGKFTSFFQGGFDGVDIFNKDRQNFTNNAAKREMDDANQGGTADSTISAYRKAIDIMSSKEVLVEQFSPLL